MTTTHDTLSHAAENTELKKRFTKRTIALIIAALLALAGIGTAVGITVYNANTKKMIADATTSYAQAYKQLAKAQAEATEATEAAQADDPALAGFLTPADAPEDAKPTIGDAALKEVTTAQAEHQLPTDKTVSPTDRARAQKAQAEADKMADGAKALSYNTTVLNNAMAVYKTQKALADATTARDAALKTADDAVTAAQNNEGYTEGFATSEQGQSLLTAVADAKRALTDLDSEDTLTLGKSTSDDVTPVAEKTTKLTEATTKLNDAVNALNDARTAHEAAKQAEAEAAQAAAAQAAAANSYRAPARSYQGGSNYYTGGGSGYTAPAPAPSAPAGNGGAMTLEEMMRASGVDIDAFYKCEADPNSCS